MPLSDEHHPVVMKSVVSPGLSRVLNSVFRFGEDSDR